ncbi:Mannosyl-oligosaccharide alpha-1,2-mannosidase 1B [Emydomyces testavorans]|uniref:alpha-1,2-Mannosidase n=1 Tax=Emydomyces testavorans TaxID=2070801 RepID=A0AAF0IE96_9EURO|nr:Mannosyl-oligosaccharide alpha-1,2-mannosidase 1B [Emydomyces testavorans]
MKSSPILAVCAAVLSLISFTTSVPTVVKQSPGLIKRHDNNTSHERAEAVKEAFRNGWGATAVDALSTAIIMEMPDVVYQILEHIATIDYSKTNTTCSLFETTIRYLGGMISAYDLLQGPFSGLVSDHTKVDVLLEQSKNLADVLKFAFSTKTGIPANELNITSKSTCLCNSFHSSRLAKANRLKNGATSNGIATIGTLVLEWTRLSDLTGDPEYGKLAQKGESYLLNPKPSSSEPFPGLIGRGVSIDSGLFQDDFVSWGGGSDSFYEYLIKMYIYDKRRFGEYRDRWVAAAQSTMKYLKSSPSTRPDLTFVATYSNGTYGLSAGHLTCFDGGNFLLGGQVLGRADFTEFGLKLVDGCHATYTATATKIGPEGFSWDPKNVPENQRELYEKAGFYITQSYYDLRPEVIESIYYAYRITKDPKYQQWAWDAFRAINATTRTNTGFTAITDVNAPGGGGKIDRQESFLFAEVMKYSYLIHAPGRSTNHADGQRMQVADDSMQQKQNGKSLAQARRIVSYSIPKRIR